MPSLFVRCLLFVSSYFPLTAIFGILLWEKHVLFAIITELDRHDGDVLSYVASYLVPFVSLDLTGTQLWAVIVFLAVLLIIYVNSNMIYINPMLNILGYHLYEVKIAKNETSFYLLTRQRVGLRSVVRVARIGDSTFLQV